MSWSILRWGIGILLIGGLIGWAVANAFPTQQEAPDEATHVTVAARTGELSDQISVNATAKWQTVSAGLNRASGTITSIEVEPGQEVTQGTALYTVNNKPVIIAQGSMPSYRDLEEGASGKDVEQLVAMLHARGFLPDSKTKTFNADVEKAVKGWQKSLGLAQTGAVDLAQIMFVPALPTRVTLDGELVRVGHVVHGEEALVATLSSEPNFSMDLTNSQASRIQPGQEVGIGTPEGGSWPAVLSEFEPNEQQGLTAQLVAKSGDSICGADCGQVPITQESYLRSSIVLTAPVSGTIIPLAALSSAANDTLTVTLESGEVKAVTMLIAVGGEAVVEGLESNAKVLVPAASQEK
ncbi:peptidoglycan-binding domain-containing protein [Jonesiaceae bacterium BS-20]|uniref:Peptidoglycan-binding domain-containing protein n=1 Tax=Jonesiaceae bacterium BS-20 TaxID=3120821 RepID=A0AAU7E001_9MICO